MNAVPQIVPITDMRLRHVEVLEKLHDGPVILAQRSKPAAVLVSVEEWDAQANELSRLKRIIKGDKALAEMKAGEYFTLEQVDAMVAQDANQD